jgi:hypothetical protein
MARIPVTEDLTSKEKMAMGLFGKNHIVEMPSPLRAESTCMVENCQNPTANRSLVEIAGMVTEADLCSVCHEKFHGQRIPAFPWKRPALMAG